VGVLYIMIIRRHRRPTRRGCR